MPSLEDVANELKSILEDVRTNTTTIQTHTASIKTDTTAIKAVTESIDAHVQELDNDLKSGFTNVAQGLGVLILLSAQSNQLAAEQNKQNEAMICWLTHIADMLCDVKRNTEREVALQTLLSKTLKHIDDVGTVVHASEAGEVARNDALLKRIEECCAKEEPRPKPCFEPCVSPPITPFAPVRVDWKPVKYNDK